MSWAQMQKSCYDKRASEFDRAHLFGRANRNHYKKVVFIAEALNLSNLSGNCRVLEIGAGTGIHAAWLLTHFPSIQLTAADLSDRMLVEARWRVADNPSTLARLRLSGADGEHLPFRDATFDAVFCSGTLHHAESQVAMLREMTRVAKPGCPVVAMEPNSLFPTNLWAAATRPEERHTFRMRPRNLIRWAGEAGLQDVRLRPVLYSPPAPRQAFPLYEFLDRVGPSIPLVRRFSVMVLLRGTKPLAATSVTQDDAPSEATR